MSNKMQSPKIQFHTPGIFGRLTQRLDSRIHEIQAIRQAEEVPRCAPERTRSSEAINSKITEVAVEIKEGPIECVPKGDGDPANKITPPTVQTTPDIKEISVENTSRDKSNFSDKCKDAAVVCQQLVRKYFWLTAIAQLLSTLGLTGCFFVLEVSLKWAIVVGVTSSFMSIVSYVFKWNPLQEKYATLGRNFLRLARNNEPNAQIKYTEYVLFMEAPILESDMIGT